ncbi:MAG: SIS domain-containing protein [Holophagales bacterium]|nr:SIS domain-containing protein [Holophagales bacterium]MXX61351.1 SIS domain-containing protein [Holophagales bacterium]MYC10177.1 SIS domain-containing protein [Holophagales bacterium]MYD24109.1 SIS domain-containing protein [Holophagales bacterium]MYI32322.1 SIS domain-containing protein [Holophagales bacterium]
MLGTTLDASAYLDRLRTELARIDAAALERWADFVFDVWSRGGTLFLVGNGGSAAAASHLSVDLGKGTVATDRLRDESHRRLRVVSLTDNVPWITAVANDLDYEQVFVQQLMNAAVPGDALMAFSGSGNSPNVLAAMDWANRHDLRTFGLTGFDGGRLKELQQDGVHVDLDDMGMVESVHVCLFHWVVDDVYARTQQTGRYA